MPSIFLTQTFNSKLILSYIFQILTVQSVVSFGTAVPKDTTVCWGLILVIFVVEMDFLNNVTFRIAEQ